MLQNDSQAETAGMNVRRSVLGDEYVDASGKRTNAFNADLHALVVDVCWDKVWARPGLDLRTRSLVNIALLAALNRPEELRLHAAGALNNGCTAQELSEVILHVAAYCGIPAALDASRLVEEAIGRHDLDGNDPSA